MCCLCVVYSCLIDSLLVQLLDRRIACCMCRHFPVTFSIKLLRRCWHLDSASPCCSTLRNNPPQELLALIAVSSLYNNTLDSLLQLEQKYLRLIVNSACCA